MSATVIKNRPSVLCCYSQKFLVLRVYLWWLLHPLPIGFFWQLWTLITNRLSDNIFNIDQVKYYLITTTWTHSGPKCFDFQVKNQLDPFRIYFLLIIGYYYLLSFRSNFLQNGTLWFEKDRSSAPAASATGSWLDFKHLACCFGY